MVMNSRAIALILLVVSGCGCFSCARSATGSSAVAREVTHETHEFVHDGRKRIYSLYIPSTYAKPNKLPLVIALHGGGGSIDKWPEYTNNGFERLAEKAPFILVYPQGLEGQWNDERNYPTSYAHTNHINDVGYLTALIDYLLETYPIDRNRVYVTGASNGGMMTHYLAGMSSDRIAAIAPVISTIPENLINRLKPKKPVPVLMINGTDDPLVLWKGGMVKFGRKENGYVTSVKETVEFWLRHDRCNPQPKITNLPDRDVKDETTVSKTEYFCGGRNADVVLYTVKGGGHTWPTYEDKRGPLQKIIADKLVGRKSRDIEACEIIWDFFKSHPRKP